MSKLNAKALTSLRQKVRRYNRDFQNEIQAYKDGANDDAAEDLAEERDVEDDYGNDDEDVPRQIQELKRSETDSSEDEWDESSSESSTSDDDDFQLGQLTAAFFLKREGDDEKDKKDRKIKVPKEKRQKLPLLTGEQNDEDWVMIGTHPTVFFLIIIISFF